MSTYGFPDGQEITQWLGQILAQETAHALGAGTLTLGPFSLANFASVIVALKATGGPVTLKVTQGVKNGPASLTFTTTVNVAAGTPFFEAFVLFGDSVTVEIDGSVGGTTLDYAVYPANTTTNAQVAGGATANIPRVSALPSAPSDGQVVAYAPDQVNFPGVEWLCIFNVATGYWDVIGGSPLNLPSSTDLATNTATWAQLGADQVVIPNAGDYDLDFSCDLWTQTNTNQAYSMPLKKATLTPITNNAAPTLESANLWINGGQAQGRSAGKTLGYSFVVGDIVVHGYNTVPNSTNRFSYPRCSIMPRRIK